MPRINSNIERIRTSVFLRVLQTIDGGAHVFGHDDQLVRAPLSTTWQATQSRCLPPIVAARLALKAPVSSATNIHSDSFAAALRALSAASRAARSASAVMLLPCA